MGINRISKLSGVSVQLHNKPFNNLYEQKKQKPYRAIKQRLVDDDLVEVDNEEIDEVLRRIPNHEGYLLLKRKYENLGLREKES